MKDFDVARFANAKNDASKCQQYSGSMANLCQGPVRHTCAHDTTANGINMAEIESIDRLNDMLMVEKSLSQFIHPSERFGDIFTDIGAWHRERDDVAFEPMLYDKLILNVKKRIQSLNSYDNSESIATCDLFSCPSHCALLKNSK